MTKRKNPGPLFFKPKRTAVKKIPQGEVTVAIEKLSTEGRGIAFHNDKPLFIAATLPGETVRARVSLDKREYAEGELCEIISPAEKRIIARCEIFGRCGGCALQMLDDAAQLQHKSETLARILRAHVETLREPVVASAWHYRHRARLTVGEDNGKPVLGFKAANSHRVVAVSHCVVLDERLQPLLEELPQWLAQLEHWPRIEEIRIAVDSENTIALALRTTRALPEADIAALKNHCAEAAVIFETRAEVNSGALIYKVPSQNTAFNFSLDDFTQVNPAVNDQLVARALAWLEPQSHDHIADFFCGLGNFSFPLAKYAKQVTGYEIDAAMVARAASNNHAAANSKEQRAIDFRAADLYAADAIIPDAYEAALLDPPRGGAKALCEHLAKTKKLQRIVYVSCNPQTLIRDIDILVQAEFRVDRAALVDMFPQTGHIEAIVQLNRAN